MHLYRMLLVDECNSETNGISLDLLSCRKNNVAPLYRTTHEVFSLGHISLSNFMLIRCIVLKIVYGDLIFCTFGYSRPKNWVLGDLNP